MAPCPRDANLRNSSRWEGERENTLAKQPQKRLTSGGREREHTCMKGWNWNDCQDMTSNWSHHFLRFFLFSRFASWCNMNVWCHATYLYGIGIVDGKVTLIPVVSSSGITYANMVSVPTEEHNRYMAYITTYPPTGAHEFNAARTTLYTSRECIHILKKRPQEIPRSSHPRCAVMTSHTTDT
jgi:hypothetical protein